MATQKSSSRARAKAPNGTDRRGQKRTEVAGAIIGSNGKPMVKITFGASELIPTGDFANVVVGPVMVERYVEDDGKLADHLNETAEIVESDCIAEQRELVLNSLKAKVEDSGK